MRTRCVAGGILASAFVLLQLAPSAEPQYSPWSAPVNLGPVVNSSYVDMQPVPSKDGLSLYFACNRPGGAGAYDLWVSQRGSEDAAWGTPVPLGVSVNTTYDELSPSLSRDGHWLFFSSSRPGGKGNRDLMVSWRSDTHDDFAWEPPIFLESLNSRFNEAGAVLFEGDEGSPAELYFNTNRPDPAALGGLEIWVSRLEADGTFGPPSRVAELCSAFDDNRVAISHNGRELYLMSNRPPSQGPDIWVSTRATVYDPWTPPELVEGLNSAAFDGQVGLSSNATLLYITSDRAGSADLYVASRVKAKGR